MPRSLARLRYRPPPKSITFPGISRNPDVGSAHLEGQIVSYVGRQSKPQNLRLQIVLNPKARRPATGQNYPAPYRPTTLKDVVDPGGTTRHGQIIYIFRNIKTNQIIYSLQELMNDHHLDQLPFIGKHSKPPAIRPDEWTPHCVITFPTPEQGHSAYRKLRELRKLHELSWKETNPQWTNIPLNARMKKIMNQRANTTADIAEVLKRQDIHGMKMAKELEEHQTKVTEFLDKKWAEIDAIANAAVVKEKPADNVKWLEHQIRSLTSQLAMKHNQNEADQRRLKNAKIIQGIRLRKIQYAQRKAEQVKTIQEGLTRTAAPANEPGAEEKLEELKSQAAELREALTNLDPTRKAKDVATDAEQLANIKAEIATLEAAFEAKAQADSRDNHIARTVLPPKLKKTLPTPFTLEGLSIRWADLQDALYAAGKWRDGIEHELLDANKVRNKLLSGRGLLSKEGYEYARDSEAYGVLKMLEDRRAEELEERRERRAGRKLAAEA